MTNEHPILTVGFVAREKFSSAAKSLASLYKNADIPFRLIVIDANIPKKYLDEMKNVLKPHDNYEIVSFDSYLQVNAQKQMVIDRVKDGYILLFENDGLIVRGRISTLLDACVEYDGRCFVIPEIFYKLRMRRKVHHDHCLGTIESVEHNGKLRKMVSPDPGLLERDKEPRVRRIVQTSEPHIHLFHKNAIDEIGGFDTTLNTREHYDLCFALHDAKIPIVLEPNVEVDLIGGPPVKRDERAFYYYRWDQKKGRETANYLSEKWNTKDIPDSSEVFAYQRHRASRLDWFFYRLNRKIFG